MKNVLLGIFGFLFLICLTCIEPAFADTTWKEDLNKSMKFFQKKDDAHALPLLQNSLAKAYKEKKLTQTDLAILETGVAESTNFRFSQFKNRYGLLSKEVQKVKLKELTASILPDNKLLLAIFQKQLGDVEKTQTLRKSIQRLEQVSSKNG